MKEKIERWYHMGLWTASVVKHAVDKGILTAAEAEEITRGVN